MKESENNAMLKKQTYVVPAIRIMTSNLQLTVLAGSNSVEDGIWDNEESPAKAFKYEGWDDDDASSSSYSDKNGIWDN